MNRLTLRDIEGGEGNRLFHQITRDEIVLGYYDYLYTGKTSLTNAMLDVISLDEDRLVDHLVDTRNVDSEVARVALELVDVRYMEANQ